MDKQRLNYLLYSIPQGVDYTNIPEELDIEDVPQERIEGLISLLNSDENSIQFQASILLANWGIDEGFQSLVKMFSEGRTDGEIPHRLHPYDDTGRHILSALIDYWAEKCTKNEQEGEIARQKIYPYIAQITEKSVKEYFSIRELFFLIENYNFTEYIPLVKQHLKAIIDNSDFHYWNIHDDIELLLKIDSDFVYKLLDKKHKNLADFGL